jgi:hypothetical protein
MPKVSWVSIESDQGKRGTGDMLSLAEAALAVSDGAAFGTRLLGTEFKRAERVSG